MKVPLNDSLPYQNPGALPSDQPEMIDFPSLNMVIGRDSLRGFLFFRNGTGRKGYI